MYIYIYKVCQKAPNVPLPVSVQLPCPQKELHTGSISREVVNFLSELCRRHVDGLVPPERAKGGFGARVASAPRGIAGRPAGSQPAFRIADSLEGTKGSRGVTFLKAGGGVASDRRFHSRTTDRSSAFRTTPRPRLIRTPLHAASCAYRPDCVM